MSNINQSLFETKAVSKATDQLMSAQTEQTISSLEVAELTGKQHKHVLTDIRNILSQLDENAQPNFRLSEYKDSTGRTLPCYRLTKEGCLCLVSGYDANLRMKIINRWKELELLTTGSTSLNLPTDYLSALKALVKSEEEKQALALENKVMKPKADYCDKVLTSQSTFTTTQVAKGYGISSAMKLNKMLKDHHIMFKQSGQWMPTSDYATKPYWEETTATISLGDDKVHTKKYYKWTELGIKWLREKFGFERYFDYNLAHNDYSDEE